MNIVFTGNSLFRKLPTLVLVEDDFLTSDLGLRQLKAEVDYLKGEKRRQMAAKMKRGAGFSVIPWDNC